MQREAPNSYELIFSRSKRAAVAQGKLRVYRATLHAVRWLHVVDSKQELVLRVVVVVREERAIEVDNYVRIVLYEVKLVKSKVGCHCSKFEPK